MHNAWDQNNFNILTPATILILIININIILTLVYISLCVFYYYCRRQNYVNRINVKIEHLKM